MRRRGAPERKGQPRVQFVCFEAASVNLKVSSEVKGVPRDESLLLLSKVIQLHHRLARVYLSSHDRLASLS